MERSLAACLITADMVGGGRRQAGEGAEEGKGS